jgi:hypothetical protein
MFSQRSDLPQPFKDLLPEMGQIEVDIVFAPNSSRPDFVRMARDHVPCGEILHRGAYCP